jgi:7-cyano-7-deazaguanine synthase in queuosine biosynthesis
MIFEKFKTELLPILDQDKTFGFFISGGLDSAVLLYICCLIRKQENLPSHFEIVTVPRYDNSSVHSSQVVNWINNQFNVNLLTTIAGNPDLHHSMQVLSGIRIMFSKLDYLMLGDTMNPAHLPGGPTRNVSNEKKIIQPFIKTYKDTTVKLAIELGLFDLMSITHTCTESKTLRCNICWQCKERAWAFSANNFIDLGTM